MQGKYNLISGWFVKISKRFLCVPDWACMIGCVPGLRLKNFFLRTRSNFDIQNAFQGIMRAQIGASWGVPRTSQQYSIDWGSKRAPNLGGASLSGGRWQELQPSVWDCILKLGWKNLRRFSRLSAQWGNNWGPLLSSSVLYCFEIFEGLQEEPKLGTHYAKRSQYLTRPYDLSL